MAHPYHHSLSSVKKWGGEYKDYIEIHKWFDQTKSMMADGRHRAILHSAFGIFLCEQVFGETIIISTGKKIPVRWIGEQHVTEDLGKIPSVQDWLDKMPLQHWMLRARRLSEELEEVPADVDQSTID
jgi:hypothetical protein